MGGQHLLLEDGQGGLYALALDTLEDLLAAIGGVETVGLVFLHACCSEPAARVFVTAGAQHVVCCRGTVFDSTARHFTRAFYAALCSESMSVGKAFEIAKVVVRCTQQMATAVETDKYMLLPEDGSHDDTFHDLLSHQVHTRQPVTALSTSPLSFVWVSHLLPARVEDFVGRARDLWQLMHVVSSGRRGAMLCGDVGIGKSALLAELAHFAGAAGRQFSGRTVHLTAFRSSVFSKDGWNSPVMDSAASVSSLHADFLRRLAETVAKTDQGALRAKTDVVDAEPFAGDEDLCRLCVKVVQALSRLEARGKRVLLIVDGLDELVAGSAAAQGFRTILTELLLKTERVVLLLGARRHLFPSLGAHKVVSVWLKPLQPADLAKLFLLRVHRPLLPSEVAKSRTNTNHTLNSGTQNRSLLLEQLAMHPLLLKCRGNVRLVRDVADCVVPDGFSLWDLARQLQ